MQSIKSLDEVYKLLEDKNITLSNKYQYSHPLKTKNRTKNMSLGRIWFNLLLPDDYILIDEAIDKQEISNIIYNIYEKYDSKIATQTIDNLHKETFKLSTICPISFSINDLIIPNELKESKKELITLDTKPEEFNHRVETLANEYLNNIGEDSGINIISKSKATGKAKPADLGVLFFSKGPIMDINGKISKPILSAQSEGYNGEEYYTAASESRKTLYIRSIFTAEPGFLARTIAYANANVILSKTIDCKTKRYYELYVTKDIRTSINGRYYLDNITGKIELIIPNLNISNKFISMRSPLYCIAKDGICHICYGQLAEKLGTKHLGLLASSTINTLGVGNSMAIRHESISVRLKEVDFTKDIIQE